MPLAPPESTNEDIIATVTPIPAADANAFRPNINAAISAVDTKAQLAQSYLEKALLSLGYGAISGGQISIGTGLSVNVAALEAMVGNYVQLTGTTVVGGLTDNTVNYLYLRQNAGAPANFTVNTTGIVPADADGGAALLWGTASTSGGVVTSVTNQRDTFRLQSPLSQQRETVLGAEGCWIGYGMQARLMNGLTILGSVTIEGRLKIDG
jgi:hypothetical protein